MALSKNYFEARAKAIKWLNGKRDFNEGLVILKESGFRPIIISKLERWGASKPHAHAKLVYELREMIQMWAHPESPRFANVDLEPDEEDKPDELAEKLIEEAEAKPIQIEDQWPEQFRRCIYLMSDCINKRAVLQRDLANLPESNDDDTTIKRAAIVEKIMNLSEVISQTAKCRLDFINKEEVPNKEYLDRLEELLLNKKQQKVKVENDELEGLSLEKLKNKLKNESTKLIRTRNLLKYQATTIQEKENPLPDCPQRVKYEKKLARLEAFIEKIKYKIEEVK